MNWLECKTGWKILKISAEKLKKKTQLLLHVTKQVNDMCGGLLHLISFSFAIKWLLLLSCSVDPVTRFSLIVCVDICISRT
jgi:hypothetical protein